MPRRIEKSYPAFKKALDNGSTLTQAKLDAGYTLNTARMGKHELPKRFLRLVERQRAKFSAISLNHSPDEQEHAVRGALLANLYEGKDRAVQSAKLLGQDKRVNMFTSEQQTGIILIQPPQALMQELQARLQSSTPLITESAKKDE